MDAASFCSGLSEWSSGQMTKSRHSRRICLTCCCCCARSPCVRGIKSSMNTSMYSKVGSPVLWEETLGVCSWKGLVIGSDSYALP